MEFLDGLFQNFLRFFSWEELSFLFTGTGVLVMLNLILSEGLLSFDNALVLAILVSHLPRDRNYRLGPFEMSIQQWALTAGIVGAYFFRIIAIVLGTYLIQFWTLQLIGGGYLLWLAYNHFIVCGDQQCDAKACGRGFWGTVLTVELMDIAFSIDSILAALGISNRVWVILTGGLLGILFMRLVAGVFVKLIERFPLFSHTGYALVSLIGYRLVSEVEWSHLAGFFRSLGPGGGTAIASLVVVTYGTAHLRNKGHGMVKSLVHLSALILLCSWTNTMLNIHMSDLVFSVIMLTAFSSTFVLNKYYVRRQKAAADR